MSNRRNADTVTWVYKHDADITIGEKHVSKAPKIILTLLIILLIALSVTAYFFRSQIYDFFLKPEIVLKETEVNLEVNTPFIPENYVAKLPENQSKYEIKMPEANYVDNTKLGDYKVPYTLVSTKDGKNVTSTLLVHVVDTTPPVITLGTDTLEIERKSNFKCMTYVQAVKDNYDETVRVNCTDDVDWNLDSYQVVYTASDINGNETSEKLTLIIKDEPSPTYVCWNNTVVWSPSDCPIQPSSSGGGGGGGNSSSSSSNSGGGGGNSSSSIEYVTESSSPYINPPHGCSISVSEESIAGLTACLSNVETNVQTAIDWSNVNFTVPGSYTVYYTGGGITETTTVTVTE